MRAESQTVKQGEAAISRQQCGKHIPAAMNNHATTKEWLEAVLSSSGKSQLSLHL
jgi:hypothetical protein